MKKILFLPFLQIPTGHHQVADALIRSLETRVQGFCLKKLDFLSYVGKRLEKLVTQTYIHWIAHAPQAYEIVYRHFVYPSNSLKYLQWYESLFLEKMQEMLSVEQPDVIVCTQAFPSFLINRLKEQGKISIPVVNVYTDFFINKIWGSKGIDFHFVPDVPLKDELMYAQRIPGKRIFVTGIPVDECFTPTKRERKDSKPYHVLISGGNAGLGDIVHLLQGIRQSPQFRYSILCGSNQKLFREVLSWNIGSIQPLPYISSREDMDDLYDQADVLITKPGGVTISEALVKKLPIFIHSALPGQEEINRQYLASQGLVHTLNPEQPLEAQILNILNDESKQAHWQSQVEGYHLRLETKAWTKILELTQR
ncbi:MAG: galactosyldiacylglycerol synthase [Desulfitobacteriaceae bacterium]|nr:galactosyldiacylglycerol synthase [Desulfitobacteriaceae bacterium]MDI6915318.1 galactosyldiacylglycerol synthase [Desulfitobacteriaceae bacterium]